MPQPDSIPQGPAKWFDSEKMKNLPDLGELLRSDPGYRDPVPEEELKKESDKNESQSA